jgi:exonuclease III
MKILLWNIEWNVTKQKQDFVLSTINRIAPSVFCLTEATDFFVSTYPNVICSTPDYGYPNPGDRRKVWLWSDDSWSSVEYGESPEMPSGRFVSGITRSVRVVGVCIPWSNAHVTTGNRNRKRWEDHRAYLKCLGPILTDYANRPEPVCVMGDYNQCIPHSSHNASVIEDLRDAFASGYTIHTEAMFDVDGKPMIDHLATTNQLTFVITGTLSRTTETGDTVSDHSGLHGNLEFTV